MSDHPTPKVDLSQADPAGEKVATGHSPVETAGGQPEAKLSVKNPPKRKRAAKPQLDHDRNAVPGGAAPPPRHQYVVVIKDSKARGLVHGEVVAVSSDDIKDLLLKDVVRNATPQEVELAQPRVRVWSA